MTEDEKTEMGLLKAIAAGDQVARAIYQDFLKERGREAEITSPVKEEVDPNGKRIKVVERVVVTTDPIWYEANREHRRELSNGWMALFMLLVCWGGAVVCFLQGRREGLPDVVSAGIAGALVLMGVWTAKTFYQGPQHDGFG